MQNQSVLELVAKDKNRPPMCANQGFAIGGEITLPGEHKVINLELPGLYTMQGSLNLAVHVINGKTAGPKLFISAAIHGNELNGVEIIRQLLKKKSLSHLKGTLIAIPIVNVFGTIQHSRYLPDGRDLNRSFPGSEFGSLASRLAHTFSKEIVNQCTHGIDLHTAGGHRTNLPQIRADFSRAGTLAMARAFGVPVVIDSPLRQGSLRASAGKLDIPLLVYEAGEALRFDPFSIRSGVNGIISVMRHLGMLPESRKKPLTEPFIADSCKWVRAPASGILNIKKQLGDSVKKDEPIGYISNPSNMFADDRAEFYSPFDGIVIGHTNIPLINEGDAVFHIASFNCMHEVASEVEFFQEEFSSS